MPAKECIYNETLPPLLFKIESLLNYLYAFCAEMIRGGDIEYAVIGSTHDPYAPGGLVFMSKTWEFGYGYAGGYICHTRGATRHFSYNKPWSRLVNTNYYDHINYVPQIYFIYRKIGCFQWHTMGADGVIRSGVGDIPSDV